MKYEKNIWWSTETKYVDTETGEEISKKKTETKEYIIIKKNKHGEINRDRTRGKRTFIYECRRNPQRELFTNSSE